MKLLEGSIREELQDIGMGKEFFLNKTLRNIGSKGNDRQKRLYQAKSFCTAKETLRVKKQPTWWEIYLKFYI